MIEQIRGLSYVVLMLVALSFGNRAIADGTLHDHQRQSAPSQNLSETPDQWVELGQRVHGGFGSYIALGIRIGLDACNS